jgi:hypothetical protein
MTMDTKTVIALLGMLLGAAGFVIGLFQYRKAQRWKAAEFVAAEVKETFADPMVRFALHLLDWNSSVHDLSQQTGDNRLKSVHIGDITLVAALTPHVDRPNGYNAVEVRIRLAFDELLGRFQRFEHFIESDLVKSHDFQPYLRYWLELLGKSSKHTKSVPVLHAIWRYIDFYRYADVQRLFARFGYDISKFPEAANIVHVVDPPQIFVEDGDAIVPLKLRTLEAARSVDGEAMPLQAADGAPS